MICMTGIGGGDIRIGPLINFLQNKFIKISAQEVDEEILRHVSTKSAANAQQKNRTQRLRYRRRRPAT